jgi:hypothetical protein
MIATKCRGGRNNKDILFLTQKCCILSMRRMIVPNTIYNLFDIFGELWTLEPKCNIVIMGFNIISKMTLAMSKQTITLTKKSKK